MKYRDHSTIPFKGGTLLDPIVGIILDVEEIRKLACPSFDCYQYGDYAPLAENLGTSFRMLFYDQKGIVITGGRLMGFWFIPMKDLRNFIARELKRGNAAEPE